MTINFDGAVNAVREALDYNRENADSETWAQDIALNALDDYIDGGLIYTSDILELWDGSTHDEINLGDYDEIADAITASVHFQLREDWASAAYDGIDLHLDAALGDDWTERFDDRDAALQAAAHGEDEDEDE